MARDDSALVLSGTIGIWVVSVAFVRAEEKPATDKDLAEKNLYTSQLDVQEGGLFVRGRCSSCHGPEGRGGRAPDLTRRHFRHGDNDQALFRNIQRGIPGTGMAGTGMPDKAVWRIVAYLQNQRQGEDPPVLRGNVERGRELFARHLCDACHWTGRGGGRRGPDLSVSRSSLEYTRRAILDPDADLEPGFQPVVMQMTDGRVHSGMLLNENTYHLQFIDVQERLHTVAKADVSVLLRPNRSLMPSR